MSVRLTAADGARVEFNAGGDLWRHRAAMHLPEAAGEYALSGSADRIVLTRKVFAFGADAVIEKRPWRFRNSFAWSLPGDTFAAPGDEGGARFCRCCSAGVGTQGPLRRGGGIAPLPDQSGRAPHFSGISSGRSAADLRIGGLAPAAAAPPPISNAPKKGA